MKEKMLDLYNWFDAHRNEIIKNQHGKIVLIHENSVAGYFDSNTDALEYAKKAGFVDEEFALQDCVTAEEESEMYFIGQLGAQSLGIA